MKVPAFECHAARWPPGGDGRVWWRCAAVAGHPHPHVTADGHTWKDES